MLSRWLSWLNCAILGVIVFLGAGGVFLWLQHPSEIVCNDPVSKQCRLPKGAFESEEIAYQSIGEPVLSLQVSPPTIQLPDLRALLIYYGKNGRPDAQAGHILLHFSMNGSKSVIAVAPEEPLYLVYDKKLVPHRYVFSPKNEKSALWVEAKPQDNEVLLTVSMQNDKGELITEPESFAHFKLPEKEFIRYAGAAWDIGTWRVDGTLLARQRARWFGTDRFLERHGGEEYKDIIGKQRIDFGENEDVYSVFVGLGDCLIWDDNQWKNTTPSEHTLNHPLLVVKKIDERLMTFELWDVEGKGKVILNLLKSNEPWLNHNAQGIQHIFKFVGARTRTQCVFEINKERILISPHDWLLMTAKGWKKLVTEEDIENYVKRKTPGTLFVFEQLDRKDGHQIMVGALYNPTRSDYQTVELPLHPGQNVKNANSIVREQKDPNSKGDINSPVVMKTEAEQNQIQKEDPASNPIINQRINQKIKKPNK